MIEPKPTWTSMSVPSPEARAWAKHMMSIFPDSKDKLVEYHRESNGSLTFDAFIVGFVVTNSQRIAGTLKEFCHKFYYPQLI